MPPITSLPPLPRASALPIVGSTLHYLKNPLGFLADTATKGDIVSMPFMDLEAWLVNDPELIDQILLRSASSFQKDVFLRQLKRVLGEGLLGSEGDFWKRQRRLIQPAFHRNHIAGYGKVMVDHTAAITKTWMDGERLDFNKAMMHLTADIVTECLFGTSVGDAAEVGACLDVVMERFSEPLFVLFPSAEKLPLPINKRFEKVSPRLDAIVRGFIEKRRAMGEPAPGKDLLAMLLNARDEDGSRMSDQQIRDEVLILFLAGHETTALALSWTFYELSRHASVEKKLHEELDRVLGGREPTLEDLPKLTYCERIIQESLRLHPPAWAIGREATQPVTIGGREYPKGAWFWIGTHALHRSPKFYPDPTAWKPERWENDFAKKIPKYAYLPFGGGPRVCIGNQFAMMEGVLLLASIAQKFSVDVVPGHPVVPVPAITLRMKHGLAVELRRRAAGVGLEGKAGSGKVKAPCPPPPSPDAP